MNVGDKRIVQINWNVNGQDVIPKGTLIEVTEVLPGGGMFVRSDENDHPYIVTTFDLEEYTRPA